MHFLNCCYVITPLSFCSNYFSCKQLIIKKKKKENRVPESFVLTNIIKLRSVVSMICMIFTYLFLDRVSLKSHFRASVNDFSLAAYCVSFVSLLSCISKTKMFRTCSIITLMQFSKNEL